MFSLIFTRHTIADWHPSFIHPHFVLYIITPHANAVVNQSIWGDWDAAFPRADYVPVTAPVCATANMMRIAQILKFLAPLAGHGSDVQEYDALLNSSVAPFNAYYALNLTNGTYVDGIEQTPALMALYIGFVPPTHIAAVQNWLINGEV